MSQHTALQDYLSTGEILPSQHATLVEALRTQSNILIAGQTSAGKSVLLEALLNSAPSAYQATSSADPVVRHDVYDTHLTKKHEMHAKWTPPHNATLQTICANTPSDAITALKALLPPPQAPIVDLLLFVSRSGRDLPSPHRTITLHEPATIFPSSKTHPQ